MKTNLDRDWGTHLPMLIKIMGMTGGHVLEMGMGMYSTPFLHWACFPDRRLVSYENDEKCYKMNKQYGRASRQYPEDFHEVHYVKSWDDAKIERPWNVAFIDHAPANRRIFDIERIANYAEYVIVHDTQRNYRFCDYKKVWPLFKYRYDYKRAVPWTTVLSNFKDLSNL